MTKIVCILKGKHVHALYFHQTGVRMFLFLWKWMWPFLWLIFVNKNIAGTTLNWHDKKCQFFECETETVINKVEKNYISLIWWYQLWNNVQKENSWINYLKNSKINLSSASSHHPKTCYIKGPMVCFSMLSGLSAVLKWCIIIISSNVTQSFKKKKRSIHTFYCFYAHFIQ